jgi:N-acetylneuraminic acid mutarotase
MPDNATWTPRTFLNVARGGFASATAGGRIHVIGGFTSNFATILASVEAHQPGNDTWEQVTPMLTLRGNPGAAAIGDRIYAFGGFDTSGTGTDLVEVFDRSANQWEQVAKLPVATTGPALRRSADKSSSWAAARPMGLSTRSTSTTRRPTGGAAMRRRCPPSGSC